MIIPFSENPASNIVVQLIELIIGKYLVKR